MKRMHVQDKEKKKPKSLETRTKPDNTHIIFHSIFALFYCSLHYLNHRMIGWQSAATRAAARRPQLLSSSIAKKVRGVVGALI